MRIPGARMTVLLLALAAIPAGAQVRSVYVDALSLSQMTGGFLPPKARKSVQGNPLRLHGTTYDRGIGSHADNVLYIRLDGLATRFSTDVGVDDEVAPNGTVRFKVWVDKVLRADSGVMRGGTRPKHFVVDLTHAHTLVLVSGSANDGISYDHADWADAKIEFTGTTPYAIPVPKGTPTILTPPPPAAPRINGPKVFGARPGSPFLYTIPATGDRPMTFSADGLPAGLHLDPATGIITGAVAQAGTYPVTFHAANASGSASRSFRIVIGDTISLTPQMGWNSYYCLTNTTTDADMRAAADAMVSSGLINHGYSYVDVDDGWTVLDGSSDPILGGPARDANGDILPNKKFPDMKALADYVHGKGLKIGLYSSPGPTTCGRFEGSYLHESQDAARFTAWGFDLLKYDYCSYGDIFPNRTLDDFQRPYRLMHTELAAQKRDIAFNLCEYGMKDVWTWGESVGGNSWRISGDLGGPKNLWENMMSVGFGENGMESYAGPGHWNDPDYLLLGYVTWWDGGPTKPTSLTYDEQNLYMTLWSLLDAPLIFSGDMTKLDAFTLNVLENDEVIAVNQDALGKQARRVALDDDLQVWAKDLEDGSVAVGLFNRGEGDTPVTVRWSDIGRAGTLSVRDLWRQKDLGVFTDRFTTVVPRHGAVLVKVTSRG